MLCYAVPGNHRTETLLHFIEVIAAELYRNIGLAIAAVSLTTLFLLSDLVASFLVLGGGRCGLME